jgi:multidrug resistance efflux pump
MIRAVALPVALLATAIITVAGDPSARNKSDEPDALDIEPPILKQNLSAEPLPATGTPDAEVARLEKQLERAKRNADGAERLYKIGVLAKVEVEQRLLRIVRTESDLATARVTQAKEKVAEEESRVGSGENVKDELDAAKATLAQLTEAAQVAVAKRERAELEAAEANVRRQQKLLKLGSADKSDVDRAQEKLAELRAPKN